MCVVKQLGIKPLDKNIEMAMKGLNPQSSDQEGHTLWLGHQAPKHSLVANALE